MENCNCDFCMNNYNEFTKMSSRELINICKLNKIKGYSTKRLKVHLIQLMVVFFKQEKIAEELKSSESLKLIKTKENERKQIEDEELDLILSEFPINYTMSNKTKIHKSIIEDYLVASNFHNKLEDIIDVRFILEKKMIMLVKYYKLYIPIPIDRTIFFTSILNQHIFFRIYNLKEIFSKCARGPYRNILISNLEK